ncbi:MAG: T9SS type A sorting domain-containing protein [Bacteroidetes bacterium]|nr:T9SS type A sorting domain-containing protein [Bacteroidota bacterium]
MNVDISHLQAGLYFMTYFTNNQQQTQKFIKTH